MPFIDPKVIEQARKIDLLTYLQTHEPHELKHVSGNTYCTKTHDSLKISNGKWHWFSRNIGGYSALDYLVKVKDMKFLDAVQHLAGQAAILPPVSMSAPPPQPPKEFTPPPKYQHTKAAFEYLKSRYIHPEVIDYFMSTGQIYETRNRTESGNVYANVVFVGTDKEGVPRYANVRGIRSSFKGDAKGSDKRYSFRHVAVQENKSLHLFEAAIDLLSYASFLRQYGADFRHENMLSLAGVYQPKQSPNGSALPSAIKQFLTDYPHITQVYLHLDNDRIGKQATAAIRAALADKYQVKNDPPKCGKDFNEFLVIHNKAKRLERNQSR